MSTVDEVRPIAVQAATRRPTRALLLAVLSRSLVVVVALSVIWAATVVRSVPTDDRAGGPLVVVAPPAAPSAGSTVAAVLEDVRVSALREGGDVVDLDLARSSGTEASVRLTVQLPGTSSSAVDRLVRSLDRSALADVAPRSVDPVPAGLRVTVDARLNLAAARPSEPTTDRRSAVVAFAEVAERAEVELRGVEVPDRPQDPVRLVVAGPLARLVELVDVIEDEYSAPQRFRSLSIGQTAAGEHQAVLTFGMREDMAAGATEGER